MKIVTTLLAALVLLSCTGLHAAEPESREVTLWYDQGAGDDWMRALPLGNGRLGCMVFGNVGTEQLLFNEDSLWSGWSNPDNDREGAFKALEEGRKLIASGNIKEATRLLLNEFCSLHGYGKPDFGAYQSFFTARLDFGHDEKSATGYHRELDLKNAVSTVSYESGGVTYKRQYFTSHPDNVAAMRFSANQPGKVSFGLSLTSLHKRVEVTAEAVNATTARLDLSGQIDNGKNNPAGMKFGAILEVRIDGGTIAASDGTLTIAGANSATMVVTGATNYALSYPTYKGEEPAAKNLAMLGKLGNYQFDTLLEHHVTDYQKLFNRVRIDLGPTSRSDIPTDQRIASYRKSPDDSGLEEMLFQYGRYLLISSSRPGGLPANLQGLWNNSNTPPWNCDYHLNINMQMNYWPVDQCNLSECMEPVVRWTTDLVKPGEKTAKIHYNSRGWTVHHVANVWGFTSPGPNRGNQMLEAESAAFLCQNLWDHYAYNQDRGYLENQLWPILKGASEFWVDNLQDVENGVLAVSPSFSPEHGPFSDGAYYQTMIVWDLFTHTAEASKVLGIESAFRDRILALRDRLQKPKLGSFGQLSEWRDPALEKNANKDTHRHVSHMYAIYPGHEILPRHEEFTAGAIKSMKFRGDDATGWSMGWKINLWARFHDGDHAKKLMRNLLSSRLYPNMLDKCPPFQIDGNFGFTAGVAEMLVQSHQRIGFPYEGPPVIELLPALPADWKQGSVAGLKARGGFIITNLVWHDGRLKTATIGSPAGGSCRLVHGAASRDLTFKAGESRTFRGPQLDPVSVAPSPELGS